MINIYNSNAIGNSKGASDPHKGSNNNKSIYQRDFVFVMTVSLFKGHFLTINLRILDKISMILIWNLDSGQPDN